MSVIMLCAAGSRDVAQSGSAPALGAGCRRFESCRPDQRHKVCGCGSMVEPEPSKLMTRVRFPSPAPIIVSTHRNRDAFSFSSSNSAVVMPYCRQTLNRREDFALHLPVGLSFGQPTKRRPLAGPSSSYPVHREVTVATNLSRQLWRQCVLRALISWWQDRLPSPRSSRHRWWRRWRAWE